MTLNMWRIQNTEEKSWRAVFFFFFFFWPRIKNGKKITLTWRRDFSFSSTEDKESAWLWCVRVCVCVCTYRWLKTKQQQQDRSCGSSGVNTVHSWAAAASSCCLIADLKLLIRLMLKKLLMLNMMLMLVHPHGSNETPEWTWRSRKTTELKQKRPPQNQRYNLTGTWCCVLVMRMRTMSKPAREAPRLHLSPLARYLLVTGSNCSPISLPLPKRSEKTINLIRHPLRPRCFSDIFCLLWQLHILTSII